MTKQQLLVDRECKYWKFEQMLNLAKKVIDWESHTYKIQLSARTILQNLGNPKYVSSITAIVKIITQNCQTAHDIWMLTLKDIERTNSKILYKLDTLNILTICAEKGVHFEDEIFKSDMKTMLNNTSELTRNAEVAMPFLKLLNKTSNLNIKYDVSFLV